MPKKTIPNGYGNLMRSDEKKPTVAYFCMEYGLTNDFRIYSGGLGILAGDLIKAARDADYPMVAVGILWRQGYTTQIIDENGQPADVYHEYRYPNLKDTGVEVRVSIQKESVRCKVWLCDHYGNVPLYLLDTFLPDNSHSLITGQLYGWFNEERLAQEIILGVGGVKALDALGVQPDIYHFNEGHAILAGLELIKQEIIKMKGFFKYNDSDFITACDNVRKKIVFTTHTPVLAGNETHDMRSMRYVGADIGFKADSLKELAGSPFNMTVAGLRLSKIANAVSELHAVTAKKMWADIDGICDIVPVTNGVHNGTWQDAEIAALCGACAADDGGSEVSCDASPVSCDASPVSCDASPVSCDASPVSCDANASEGDASAAASGGDVCAASGNDSASGGNESIESDANASEGDASAAAFCDPMWDRHFLLKQKLIAEIERRNNVRLPSDRLFIGFARRAAPYKRSDLIFSEPEKIIPLLESGKLCLIFAGKAHPNDLTGKTIIANIYEMSQKYPNSIVFIQNYDMDIGKLLTQGCDVWLNNPIRPLEASGTSGMKAAMNGVLNLSILDGWWPECCVHGVNGWQIGGGYEGDECDEIDSRSLYSVLFEEVIPVYYDDRRKWLEMMYASIEAAQKNFSAARMLDDYVEKIYNHK